MVNEQRARRRRVLGRVECALRTAIFVNSAEGLKDAGNVAVEVANFADY